MINLGLIKKPVTQIKNPKLIWSFKFRPPSTALGRGWGVLARPAGGSNLSRISSTGIGLVETIVAVAVFVVVAAGVYQSYLRVVEVTRNSRAKVAATAVLNDDIELVRNLPYQDVGVSGALPSGKLTRNATTTRSGFDFVITRTIRSIDDPFDGTIGGTPGDSAPADYKLAEIEINCTNCRNFKPFKQTTTVAPKNLEISSGGGALFIRVLDANGLGVPQAMVHIENKKLTPNLIIDELTNNQGILQLVDVPQSVGGYNTKATKAGYSTDQTYPPGGSDNPNPVKADSTILAGEVTQLTLVIDRVSTINVSSTNQVCAVLPNVAFRVDGSKLIGTNPDKLKYSLLTATDANGDKTLSNLEWDVYNFTITDSSYDLSGSIPILPLNLAPNTTQDLKLLVSIKVPRSLLITAKDAATGLPISGANVRLEKTGYSAEAVTGRGAMSQTDWSGGAGQVNFLDPARYFDSDGNIDTSGPGGELKLRRVSGDYLSSGWLESSTFDTGSVSDFHNISWQPQDQPPDTGANSVKFQVASSNTNSAGTVWTFVGPDGTQVTYYTLSNTDIANHSGKRYLRYKVFLSTADSKKTPNVSDISFTFTSSCVPPGQVFFNGLASGTYTLTVTRAGYQTWSNTDIQIASSFQSQEVLMNQ